MEDVEGVVGEIVKVDIGWAMELKVEMPLMWDSLLRSDDATATLGEIKIFS